MNKLILKDIKKPKKINDYIFVRGNITIDGEVDCGCDDYNNHLVYNYTELSLKDDILVLEKNRIIIDNEVTDHFIKKNENIFMSDSFGNIHGCLLPYMLKYEIPNTHNIVKIWANEFFAFNPNEFSKLKKLESNEENK